MLVHTLVANDLRRSMGRVGACGENAAMESFFALLQRNVLDRQRWSSRAQLRLAIVTWIEKTYHRNRRQRRLGRLTPIEFETINQAARGLNHSTQPVNGTGGSPVSMNTPDSPGPGCTTAAICGILYAWQQRKALGENVTSSTARRSPPSLPRSSSSPTKPKQE
jgi:hypothetical protein